MSGKAKPEQRRAYEQRARTRGNGMVTVRLSPGANRMLQAICEQYQCTSRDVVEGLLLGTVKPNPLRLSESEIECAHALGVRL